MHEKLDERIVKLVGALNAIPGVATFSSCGGHADWRERCACAVPADQFWVALTIEPSARGWAAADLIAWAVARMIQTVTGDPESLDTVLWYASDARTSGPSRAMALQVNGRNGADPDALAEILVRELSRVPRQRRRTGREPARGARCRSTT